MIIHTGMRTDIPAFYTPWLCNRLRAGSVCVRNSFDRAQVTRYRLDTAVVDLIGFCTKNPAPMLPHMELLRDFGQLWHVTITPYGRDVEPHVPPWREVAASFAASLRLSERIGLLGVTILSFSTVNIHWTFTAARSGRWQKRLQGQRKVSLSALSHAMKRPCGISRAYVPFCRRSAWSWGRISSRRHASMV